jgi:hypothetical protein
LRVEIESAAGAVSIGNLKTIVSSSALPPEIGGDHVLVARKNGAVAAAMPFKFPAVILAEGFGADGTPFSKAAPIGDLTRTTVLVPGGDYDELSVLDADGNVAARARPPQPAPGERQGALSAPGLFPDAPGLDVLTPADTALIPPYAMPYINGVVDYATLPQAGKDNLQAGFKRTAPGPRGAIRSLLLAHAAPGGPAGAFFGLTWGSFVVINADVITDFKIPATVVHETAHSYNYLLDNPTAASPLGHWPPDVVAKAADVVAANALASGFSDLWSSVQNDGIKNGIAGPYQGDRWPMVTDVDANTWAFIGNYGSQNVAEDIATYAQIVQDPTTYGPSAFCSRLQAATAPFPLSLAIPFIKIKLMENTGFVSSGSAAGCTGGGVPIEGPNGVVLGDHDVSFTGDRQGGYSTDPESGLDFLVVLATGPNDYRISIRIYAPGRKPPLGLRRLDNLGIAQLDSRSDGVLLASSSSNFAWTSAGGLALVNEVSASRISIAVFNLGLRNAFNIVTDLYPFSTFVYAP